MRIAIRFMTEDDWAEVRSIYLEGIATGDATFETESPTWEQWDAARLSGARLIAMNDERIIGWAALSPVSKRAAYSGVTEVSVYVAESSRGHGVGKELLKELITASEKIGIWTLQASVFPENSASIALHKSLGFREVGFRERVAKLNSRWRNTLVLERRSALVGTE